MAVMPTQPPEEAALVEGARDEARDEDLAGVEAGEWVLAVLETSTRTQQTLIPAIKRKKNNFTGRYK